MTLQLLQLLGIHKVIIGHADHHSKRIFEFGAIQTNRQEREVVHQDKAVAAAPPGAQTTQTALTWWKSSFSCRLVCMAPNWKILFALCSVMVLNTFQDTSNLGRRNQTTLIYMLCVCFCLLPVVCCPAAPTHLNIRHDVTLLQIMVYDMTECQ